MSNQSERSPRSERFRTTISNFITTRRDAKLKGKEDDAEAAAKYDYTTWLADAARRVGQIQAVTHVLKATHPDARGSSLHVRPETLPQHPEIGSHSLGENFAEDVVGNAAALDVFKFLKLEVDGRKLLDWMQKPDPNLLAALHTDTTIAQEWATAFSRLVRTETQTASHAKAKQLYWLTGDDPTDNSQYLLLQPLFSSSLAHAVHDDIQEARFGEPNKLARQARRSKEAHDNTYRDYRNLVIRKLGGTKPQNISQLNSERGGINYLLPSLPPQRWQDQNRIKLHNVESALDGLRNLPQVRSLIKELAAFLLTDPPSTMKAQQKREAIEQALGAQLPVFAERIKVQMQQPGWTRTDCELALCEQLWLDAERTELELRHHPEEQQKDQDFNAAYHWGDWQDQIAIRFANWVNDQLRIAGLTTVGTTEAKQWARQAVINAAWPVPMQRRMGETA